MRFEWLFLRWLVIIALAALGLRYALSWRRAGESAHYQKVVLLEGAKSFGLPLAGIAVDPARREVVALLGKPPGNEGAPEFFILWKARNGRTYGATFSDDNKAGGGICEISPEGEMTTLHNFRSAAGVGAEAQLPRAETPQQSLRMVLAALPADGNIPGR